MQQGADEASGLVRDVLEALLVELVAGRRHQSLGLRDVVSLEWALPAQPAGTKTDQCEQDWEHSPSPVEH